MTAMASHVIPNGKTLHVYRIDAAEEASSMKMQKVFNMIVLGGFMKVKPILKIEYVVKGLKKVASGKVSQSDSNERGGYQKGDGNNQAG